MQGIGEFLFGKKTDYEGQYKDLQDAERQRRLNEQLNSYWNRYEDPNQRLAGAMAEDEYSDQYGQIQDAYKALKSQSDIESKSHLGTGIIGAIGNPIIDAFGNFGNTAARMTGSTIGTLPGMQNQGLRDSINAAAAAGDDAEVARLVSTMSPYDQGSILNASTKQNIAGVGGQSAQAISDYNRAGTSQGLGAAALPLQALGLGATRTLPAILAGAAGGMLAEGSNQVRDDEFNLGNIGSAGVQGLMYGWNPGGKIANWGMGKLGSAMPKMMQRPIMSGLANIGTNIAGESIESGLQGLGEGVMRGENPFQTAWQYSTSPIPLGVGLALNTAYNAPKMFRGLRGLGAGR